MALYFKILSFLSSALYRPTLKFASSINELSVAKGLEKDLWLLCGIFVFFKSQVEKGKSQLNNKVAKKNKIKTDEAETEQGIEFEFERELTCKSPVLQTLLICPAKKLFSGELKA